MAFTIRSMVVPQTPVSDPNADFVSSPRVTALPDGRYVGLWRETIDGVSATKQHLFDASGRLLASSRIDDPNYPITNQMGVTALIGGGYVATWRSTAGICQRSFGADGAPAEVRLITAGESEFPEVTALPDGGYLVTEASNTDATIISQRFFGADGRQLGPARVANEPSLLAVSVRDVAVLKTGDYVVTWQPVEGTAVYQRLFDEQGTPKGSETLIEHANWGGSLTALAGGGYVVTSYDGWTLSQHAFDANGQEAGPRSIVSDRSFFTSVSVEATSDGFVIRWSDSLGVDAPTLQQIFDHLGNPVGGRTPVPYLGLKTEDYEPGWEVIKTLSNGRQVVMWDDWNGVVQVLLGSDNLPGLTAGADLAQGTKDGDVLVVAPGTLGPGDVLNGRDGMDVLQFEAPGTFDLRAPAQIVHIEEVRGSAGQDILFAKAEQLESFARIGLGDGDDIVVETASSDSRTVLYQRTTLDFGAGNDVLITDRSKLEVGDRTAGTGIDMGLGFDLVRFTGSSFDFPSSASHGLRGVDGIAVNDPSQAASQTFSVTSAAFASLQSVDLGGGEDVLQIEGGTFVLAGKSLVGIEVVTVDPEDEWSEDDVLVTDAAHLRPLSHINLGHRRDPDQKDVSWDVLKLIGGGTFDLSSKSILGVERILVGDQKAAAVTGTTGDNRIGGGSGPDVLRGFRGNDSISGGGGSDRLEGDSGRDKLTGGRGRDTFAFDTKPGSTNVDTLVDFNVRDDRIWLDNAVFKKLGRGTPASPKKLSADAFFKGAGAADREDRIVFDPSSGGLFYDPDGTGPARAVKFAQMKASLALTHADFFVV